MAEFVLISSDELRFSTPVEAAELSTVIKEVLENNGSEAVVDKHKGNTLKNIVNFLTEHTIGDEAAKKEMMIEFLPSEFCNLAELFETALAAHDLGIPVLEDLVCKRIAEKIKHIPAFYVKKEFEDATYLTPEQVAFTEARYPWAFESGRP